MQSRRKASEEGSLLIAFKNGLNRQAREDMAMTSLFGGLALANAGLGAVHGFAGPIGGMFNAPHGAICASLLSSVMKYNVQELGKTEAGAEVRKRYQKIFTIMTGDQNVSIQEGVSWISQLADDLRIPGLREIGVKQSDFDQIITKSKVSSSMQKNPVVLEEGTMRAILSEAY